MEGTTMSPADVMAMMNSNGMNGNGMWNNPFMYLIWLAIFGNAGFGGWGNNNGFGNAAASAVDRAALADGLNNQTVLNDLRNIEIGVGGVDKTVQSTGNNIAQQLCSGFSGVNLNTTNGFNNVGMSILKNTNDISSAIAGASATQQIANCQLSHAIQDNKYEMAQNTCAITTAIHQEGEMTRGLITNNTIQDLRDKLSQKDNELQSAQLTLANGIQTNSILDRLGRFVPYNGGCVGNSW